MKWSTQCVKAVLLLFSVLNWSLAVAGQEPNLEVDAKHHDKDSLVNQFGVIDLEILDRELQKCPVVERVNDLVNHEEGESSTSLTQRAFGYLFPFGPGANALLATAYISGPPNLILALMPANIDPSSLSSLIAFAIGGLLGDVFFHLMPQTFLGESHEERARFVLVDEKRNSILGFAILVGFGIFILIDKLMRIFLRQDTADSHSHSHSHSHADATATATSTATDLQDDRDIKRRKVPATAGNGKEIDNDNSSTTTTTPTVSIKLSAYLNMIADFSHNITDGLAIAASFYVSKSVGATTCLAVFVHEVPHEVGDFALLIQGGFSKSRALGAQFVTAIGAFLGTIIGITINRISQSSGHDSAHFSASPGIMNTSVQFSDLVLPFTAGGFLYIATVGAVPEILELQDKSSKVGELSRLFKQTICLLLGAGMMFLIAWNE